MLAINFRAFLTVLQLLVAPLAAAVLALWAGWLALAGEAEPALPRVLSDQVSDDAPSDVRGLHVVHLVLLLLAGAFGAIALAWWTWPAHLGLSRLALVVILVWIVGDVLPRLLASLAPELPEGVRRPAVRSLTLFRPVLRLLAWADRHFQPRSVEAARRDAGNTRRDMLLGLFSLADTTVAEVMTPRIDVVAVDVSSDREEVIATLQRSEHARILVYDDHPDAIVGVLFAKDMLAALAEEGQAAAWAALVRPAGFVPEGKTLDRQLRDFQRGPGHLAVVVDEFGGTAGIVTLEDILEQIVGEIQDEYDIDEVASIQQTDSHLLVQGNTPLAELEAALGHSFGRDDVSTVGGLALAAFGRVPRGGEAVDVDGYRLVADQVVRRRVRRVQVERPARVVEGPGEEAEE